MLGIELIQLSSKEILATKSEFFPKAEEKLASLKLYLSDSFGIANQGHVMPFGRVCDSPRVEVSPGALAVTRPGAGPSIPDRDDIEVFVRNNQLA